MEYKPLQTRNKLLVPGGYFFDCGIENKTKYYYPTQHLALQKN